MTKLVQAITALLSSKRGLTIGSGGNPIGQNGEYGRSWQINKNPEVDDNYATVSYTTFTGVNHDGQAVIDEKLGTLRCTVAFTNGVNSEEFELRLLFDEKAIPYFELYFLTMEALNSKSATKFFVSLNMGQPEKGTHYSTLQVRKMIEVWVK
jgi:hypothetical protein